MYNGKYGAKKSGHLSPREIEVLDTWANKCNFDTKETAKTLNIQFSTMKAHTHSIRETLHAHTTTEAYLKAYQMGLVEMKNFL